jgi:hypothetical protein
MHGGLSLKGPSHPRFAAKGYSKHAPATLRRLIESASASGRATDELALVRARIAELLERLEVGDILHAFRRLRIKLDRLRAALAGDAPAALVSAIELLDSALGDDRTWHEIKSLLNTQAKLLDVHRRIESDFSEKLTAEGWHRLFGLVGRVLREHYVPGSTVTVELNQRVGDALLNLELTPYRAAPELIEQRAETRRLGRDLSAS